MSNPILMHIVRRVGTKWHLMTAGGNFMPAGLHIFDYREEAWERAVILVYEDHAVGILYGWEDRIEWIVRHTPRAEGDPRPRDRWEHRPGRVAMATCLSGGGAA